MGFEEGDMKNIVNPEVGWKGEPVSSLSAPDCVRNSTKQKED